jgi:hypothetical protein
MATATVGPTGRKLRAAIIGLDAISPGASRGAGAARAGNGNAVQPVAPPSATTGVLGARREAAGSGATGKRSRSLAT